MPRPLWSGSVGFGLVNVPVKLFKAQSPKDVRFHQLHRKDGIRIQQKRVCPADEEEVPYEEIVKGYEISPDRYVLIDPEELRALDAKSGQTIEVMEFVDLDQIDPLLYESGYYVVPDTKAEKPYALLASVLEQTGKVALAKFVMRTKEHLCVLRPKDGGLLLETLMFPDEIVAAEEVGYGARDVEMSEKELMIATQLVESLSAEFEPDKYRDEYREKVLALIEAKAAGNEIVERPAEAEPAQVIDLMAALEASLEAAKAKQVNKRKHA